MENQNTDRDPDVVSFVTFKGLRNEVTPERFEMGDLARADNIDIDMSGRIGRRKGSSLLVAGAAHSLWSDDEDTVCFFGQGNTLYSMSPTLVPTPVTQLLSGGRISFTKVNDRTYFTNAVDTGVIEQGAARSWGVVPPTLPGVNFSVGNMNAGTYQYTMTFVRSDGQESGAPMPGLFQIVADGGSVEFVNIPVSTDPDVVAKNIYMSPPNGEQLFMALVLANSITQASYANDATELTVPIESLFLTNAPPGQLVAFYRSRMWVAVGDTLYPSKEFDYERFDPREYIQMDGRITLLAPMTDKEITDAGRSSGFFVGTEKSCGVLVGSEPGQFQYVPKTSYGAIFGTLAYIDGSVFRDGSAGARPLPMWITPKGAVVGLPEMLITNLTVSKFRFPVGKQGAAVYLDSPNRYIATSFD
jgi:hypothetical protein